MLSVPINVVLLLRSIICFNQMLRTLIDFLVPAECRLCGMPLPPGDASICGLCTAGMPRTGYHMRPDNSMAMRFAGRFPFERAAGHFYYAPEAGISHLIQDFKYRGAESLARELGAMVANEIGIYSYFDNIDVIMPVPLHWTKLIRRGYNQTERLARGVSDVTGIPVSRDLKAFRPHRSQTRVSAEERLVNADGIFRLDHPESYAGKGILLMDDVCTTGATLTSAADAVLAGVPDARISILTLAVTV